jgi:hypothetical protein
VVINKLVASLIDFILKLDQLSINELLVISIGQFSLQSFDLGCEEGELLLLLF